MTVFTAWVSKKIWGMLLRHVLFHFRISGQVFVLAVVVILLMLNAACSVACEFVFLLVLFQPCWPECPGPWPLGGDWLPPLRISVCWPSSKLVLKGVSGCDPWHSFKPTNPRHHWFCSMWVTCCCYLWFHDQALHWLCRRWATAILDGILSSTLTKLPLPLRMWVATITGIVQACWPDLPSTLKEVSSYCSCSIFKWVDQASSSASELQLSISSF